MPNHKQEKAMIGAAPNLAKACQVRYDKIDEYSNIYQQVLDEIKHPDKDFVADNADEIGDMLSQLFAIADSPFLNADIAVDQLADVKNLLIEFRAAYCERETDKRAYPK